MDIIYKETKEFDLKNLRELYLSVGWKLGNHPEELQVSMKNSHKVFSAWDGDRLVGIINCLSDGISTVYFNNLLVNPQYQKMGIGFNLMNMMLSEYSTYKKKVLIADSTKISFYEKLGFTAGDDVTPMIFTGK